MIWSVLHNCCYKNVVCNEIYCKQPAGAKWLSFSFILWPARRKYIHGIYCNGGGQFLVEAPWTLVPSRWHDGDHTKTHKMEI